MGAVYLAHDRERDKRVALKTLRRVDASGIYRFKREFRALADLRHPNLVVLYDLFADGSEWFFTMEYVEGEPFLASVSESLDLDDARGGTRNLGRTNDSSAPSRYPTPVRDVPRLRQLLLQVARAIAFVHGAGKLHRDLKPDNVMVTPEGRAVVLDFGIALERADAHGTHEAGVVGTPAYMSPEQAHNGAVTGATDWYAFGVMMYEALTGVVPFDGNYLDVLRRKQGEDVPAPSATVSGVPPDLDGLCFRLLSRDPADRPNSDEVLAVLGDPGPRKSDRPPPGAEQSIPFVGREGQLHELDRALHATDGGRPVVAFVHGPTGMGKTALIEHFLAGLQADGEVTVLQGRCYERELVPFKAFDSLIDSLSRYLRWVKPVHAADAMPRDIRSLAELFPVLKRVELVGQLWRRSAVPSGPAAQRAAAFAALKELLLRLSQQRRLVLFIDDLQWGDVDSSRLIAELITGEGAPAMLLVCTYRSGDVGGSTCLRTLFDRTRKNQSVDTRQVTVGPMSDQEMRALCLRQVDRSLNVDIDTLLREARGNPYLLMELMTSLRMAHEATASVGLVSLTDALRERLSTLEDDAQTVLEAVSVAGRPVAETLLIELLGGVARLHSALAKLRDLTLVRGVGTVDDRAIETYHEGIRRAVLASLDDASKKRWHRRLADVMEAVGSPEPTALTEHLIGAEEFAHASVYAIRAAVQASRALAFDKAAELYAIAVRHHADAAWREELTDDWAEALVNAGRDAEAAEVYLQAAARTSGARAVELQRKAGVQLIQSGYMARGKQALGGVLESLDLSLPTQERDALAECAALHRDIQARGFRFERVTQSGQDPALLERYDAIWEISQAFLHFDPFLVMPMALRNLQQALSLGEPRRVALAMCSYYMQFEAVLAGHRGEPPRALAAAEALAQELHEPSVRAWVAMARGGGYQIQGLFKPALLHLSQAEEIFRTRSHGSRFQVRTCRQTIAYLFTVLGQSRDFMLVEQWIAEAEEREDLLGLTHLRLLAVHGALAEDDLERAERYVRAQGAWDDDAVGLTLLLRGLAHSRLALYTGDVEGAPEFSEQLRLPSPNYAVPSWRADRWLQVARLKLLEASQADDRQAVMREMAEAMAKCEATGVSYYADHLALCRAAAAYLSGDRDGALVQLDAVLTAAEQSGDGQILLACAALRKGQLLGGLDGARMVADAERSLQSRGIRRPLYFARIYAPGFGDETRVS